MSLPPNIKSIDEVLQRCPYCGLRGNGVNYWSPNVLCCLTKALRQPRPPSPQDTINRVVESNDWEYRTFSVGGRELYPDTDGVLLLQFPDGTRANVPILWRKEAHSHFEQGSAVRTSVTSTVPFAVIHVHGADVPVRLTELDVVVIARYRKLTEGQP